MPEANVKPQSNSSLTDEEKKQRIEELRKMIEDYTCLDIRTDDVFLMRYLACCEWNAEDAFVRIKKIFKLKYDHPKWFLNKNLCDYKDLLKHHAKQMLPGRDKKGRRVYLSRMSAMGHLGSLYDLAQLDDLWFEAMLNEIETIEKGIVVLVDMSGSSWKMLKWLVPGNVKIASTKADLLPLKQMEVHVVNSSAFMSTAIGIVFPMLSQSIKDQVFFHYQNYPSLHEHLGREVLPQCYGGLREDVNFDELNSYLYNHENYLNKCPTYGFVACPIESVSKEKKKHSKHTKDNLVIAESI